MYASIFQRDGAQVVVDDASLQFVKGATIDYVQEMIRSSFAVVNNPNSESACGESVAAPTSPPPHGTSNRSASIILITCTFRYA